MHKKLSRWLLSNRGMRFLEWFVRRNHKKLLSSEFGAKFVNWVSEQVLKDSRKLLTPIVIEISHDGMVRVFGKRGTRVRIVNIIRNHNDCNETLARELSWLRFSGKSGPEFLNDMHWLTSGYVKDCQTVQALCRRDFELEFLKSLDEVNKLTGEMRVD